MAGQSNAGAQSVSRAPPRIGSLLGGLAFALGLILLVLGEIAFDESMQMRFEHDPAFEALRAPFLTRFLPGIVGVTFGATLIGLGARRLGFASALPAERSWVVPVSNRRRRVAHTLIGIGVVLSATLCAQILASDPGRWDESTRAIIFTYVRPPLFFASIGFGLVGCALLGTTRYERLPFDRWDAAWTVAMMALFVAETVPTLEDWRYSFIGDEHAFYQVAYELASGRSWDMFWQAGVYSTHPLVSSWIPAVTMRIFGDDFTGWKLGSVAIALMIVALTYLAGRWLFDRTVALVASAIVATSHYLFAYSHTGHNNIDSIPPVILTILMVGLATRRPSRLTWFLAGVAGGSSLYFFFAARVAGPMLAIGTLLRGRAGFRSAIGPAALGCALAIAPFVARNQLEILTRMLVESATTKQVPLLSVLYEIISLTGWSAVAFHWSDAHGLYISLGLLDPLSAALSAAGVGIALFAPGDWRRRALAIWFVAILLITGGFARHSGISVPRLLVAVPILGLFAGDAVRAIGRSIGVIGDRVTAGRRNTGAVLLIAFVAAVVGLNLYRFRVQTPLRNHVMPETMIVAVVYDERCRVGGAYPLVIWGGRSGGIATMLSGYEPGTHVPMIVTEPEFLRIPAYQRWSCVVVHHAEGDTARRVVDAVRRAQPGAEITTLTDTAGRSSAVLITRPGETSPAAGPLGEGRLLYAIARGDSRRGAGLGALQEIADIARDPSGRWFVADRGNRRITEFDASWRPIAHWGRGVLSTPTGLAADDRGLVVLDAGLRAIVLVDSSGSIQRTITWSDLALGNPTGIAIDRRGRIIIADESTGRLLAFERDIKRVAELRMSNSDPDPSRNARTSDIAVASDGSMALYEAARGRVIISDEMGRATDAFETGIRDGRIAVGGDGSIWIGGGQGRGIARYGRDGRLIADFPQGSIYGGFGEGGVAGIIVDDTHGELVVGWRYQSVTRYRVSP
ncbi:MAG: hypothetical protein EPO26_05680 [Chloroflexota bacterium]|nr:MAG: hypothetical protein EPO26_05680 [Chloroflexota bacterium]